MLDFTDEVPGIEFLHIVRGEDSGDLKGCAVQPGPDGQLTRHFWPEDGEATNPLIQRVTQGQHGGYFTPATFHPHPNGKRQRLRGLVHSLRCIWADLEGPNKANGHASEDHTKAALGAFAKSTGLIPTIVLLTGSGGAHAYHVFDRDLDRQSWQGRADAFVWTAERNALNIDAPITTDAARIMRMPGSIHQKTGETVKAYRTGPIYPLEELDGLLGYEPGKSTPGSGTRSRVARAAEPPRHRAYSMLEVIKHCAALRVAIANRGADTPYQPWLLALQMARLSVEGEGLGHAISQGHPDYDQGEVDRKMDSFTGGPPSCEAWHRAWGERSPCPDCLYGGIAR
ncbi:hypothetical protein ACT80S_06450 [Ramlibacter sp. MAHUQ-53]|uniref:hypothetical protein n=1 Tax=unclassified Ramlibacter TaxID=2617605 RepID=UPI003637D275